MHRLAFALLATALALPACDSGSSDDEATGSDEATSSDAGETGSEAVDFAADIQPVLEGSCLCHFQNPMGMMTAPYLSLNEGMGIAELVGVDSEQVPSLKRVAPGDPENSYLMHKLRGTHIDVGGPADSDPMPPLGTLPEQHLVTIETWISEGANG